MNAVNEIEKKLLFIFQKSIFFPGRVGNLIVEIIYQNKSQTVSVIIIIIIIIIIIDGTVLATAISITTIHYGESS